MDNKKSQSQIVSTVLLLLIVMAAITIIMGFVIPFVNQEIKKGDCIDVVREAYIVNDLRYTCYEDDVPGNENVSVQVHIGDIENKIEGFIITLGGASGTSYDIKEGTIDPKLKMYSDVGYGEALTLPRKSEERTYVIDTSTLPKPDNIGLYLTLTNGYTCDASDIFESVEKCE